MATTEELLMTRASEMIQFLHRRNDEINELTKERQRISDVIKNKASEKDDIEKEVLKLRKAFQLFDMDVKVFDPIYHKIKYHEEVVVPDDSSS